MPVVAVTQSVWTLLVVAGTTIGAKSAGCASTPASMIAEPLLLLLDEDDDEDDDAVGWPASGAANL